MGGFFTRYAQELSVVFLVFLVLVNILSLVWFVRCRKAKRPLSPGYFILAAVLLMALVVVVLLTFFAGSNHPPVDPTPYSLGG